MAYQSAIRPNPNCSSRNIILIPANGFSRYGPILPAAPRWRASIRTVYLFEFGGAVRWIQVGKQQSSNPAALAFSHDGRMLAVGHADGTGQLSISQSR